MSEASIDSGSRQPGFKFQFGLLDCVTQAEQFTHSLCFRFIFFISEIILKSYAPSRHRTLK